MFKFAPQEDKFMIRFETFYICCPNCGSYLEGKRLKSEMVNQSILYSDGKTLNDNYITEPQKMVICPACNHWFWIDDFVEPLVSGQKPDVFYTWNNWRFYGVKFGSNDGKVALIKHYKDFLTKIKLDEEKELYFRRLLWWAYNDFVRDKYQISLKYLFSGKMSFGVWIKNRRKIISGIRFFKSVHAEYVENLRRLNELLDGRYIPSDERYEAANLERIEILREMGSFNEAAIMLALIPRRTHYIANIAERVKKKDSWPFLVTG